MLKRNQCSKLIVQAVLLLSVLFSPTEAKEKKKQVARGMPVLWSAPAKIDSRNLYLGPGGAGMRPNLRRITFLEEEGGGYSTKYRIRDGSGRV